MASECIGGVPDCTFWFDSRQQSYAKTDEIITRHLRLHQILEMRRYSENLERILDKLAGVSQTNVKPVPIEQENAASQAERVSTYDGRCITCGFPLLSKLHLERPCGQKQEVPA